MNRRTDASPAPTSSGEPAIPETSATRRSLRRLLEQGELTLPSPGRGDTAGRHRALAALARHHGGDLARLAEGHVDALAILAEAGRQAAAACLYGVWASAVQDSLCFDPDRRTLTGRKPFCSGLGVVDRALVTALDVEGRVQLLEVVLPPGVPTFRFDRSGWATPALAGAATGAVHFDGHPATGEPVGRTGWYLERVGFWHGACGPAAVWAGLAGGLVDVVEQQLAHDDDPHHRAHLGALRSIDWALAALLDQAGDQIDDEPFDAAAARWRAMALRHQVESLCREVLDRAGRAAGPRLYTATVGAADRAADLALYLRQHHAERDDEVLGRLSPAPAGGVRGAGRR
ncbi:MAG: hypothetical protein AB7O92_02010 [Acidimicrobiia bacterium]